MRRYTMICLLVPMLIIGTTLYAQPGAVNPMIAQTVDCSKGYVLRIPATAVLDSLKSGWSQKRLLERRVYVMSGIGEIRLTVTIKPVPLPDSVVKTKTYTYNDQDSSTSFGTAYIRTYYLPTRHVRIELIPYGKGMVKYSTERKTIYDSFRWKPGANTDKIIVDAAPAPPTKP